MLVRSPRFILVFFLTVFILFPYLASRFALNTIAIQVYHFALAEKHPHVTALNIEGRSTPCEQKYFQGLLFHLDGDEQQRDLFWLDAIHCASRYIVLLRQYMPDNRDFAEIAVQEHPEIAEGWFWLAESYIVRDNWGPHPILEENRGKVINIYEQGLRISPFHSERWRELGDLYVEHDPQAAIDAYLKSCFTGDLHHNGCWRAGLTAEAIGDITNAIRYFRYSDLPFQRARADQLEAKLNSP